MSIELMPPTPTYPNKYHVRKNWCKCHPETCQCDDWAVHAPDGSKHETYFRVESAIAVAAELNEAYSKSRSDAYDRIDRFLRNALDDDEYAEYLADLDVIFGNA